MDTAFHADESHRRQFIRLIMQSFACTYICSWSYVAPPSEYLFFLDGFYNEERDQASSSSGSLARRLFNEYQQQFFAIQDGRQNVPGLAFHRNLTYIELNTLDLLNLASTEIQRQFYREARIKTAIFMGCSSGELEIGFSDTPQMNLEKEMRKLFPENFSGQSPLRELPQPAELLRASSSSSSLKSLSMGSPEYSSLIFNIPSTSVAETLHTALQPPQATTSDITTSHQQAMQSLLPIALQAAQATTTNNTTSHQQAMQPLFNIPNVPFLTPETEHAAMTTAILNVLSSSSLSAQDTQRSAHINQRTTAFRSYTSALNPRSQIRPNLQRRQNMMRRAIEYYRTIHSAKIRATLQGSRPTSTQLHHMISERRRREKLNESFQALRSLLPPGTKKDKASVLASTREYLSSLIAQVEELIKRNQQLEAQLEPAREAVNEEVTNSLSRNNFHVWIRQDVASASTSEGRIVDLNVAVRDESCPISDVSIRILEFLKQDRNVSLMSMEGNTHMAESAPSNHLILRLRIEGNEWDEAAFLEAVRRVVADLVR